MILEPSPTHLIADVEILLEAKAPINDVEALRLICEKLGEGMGPDATFRIRDVRWGHLPISRGAPRG